MALKDSDVPELDSAWWKKNQPATLPATGLGEALRHYERARGAIQKKGDGESFKASVQSFDDALAALDDLTPAVKKAQEKCNKVLHATCLKVLTKYPNVIVKEREALRAAREQFVTESVQTCKTESAKVIQTIIDEFKKVELLFKSLEDTADQANEVREQVAQAVASQEPNAGDLEVTIVDSHLRDATRTCNELLSLAKKAQDSTLKAWNRAYSPGFKNFDKQIGLMADRAEQQHRNFEVVMPKAEKLLEGVAAAAKAVRQMADGQGNLEEQFLKVCEMLEERTQKVMGGIRSSFAESGGQLDRADFNLMNYGSREHEAYQDKAVLEEAKAAIQRAVTALNAGKKDLTAGKSNFDRTMKSLPEFANKRNRSFKPVLEALEKADEIYRGYEKEYAGLALKLNMVAGRYKEAL